MWKKYYVINNFYDCFFIDIFKDDNFVVIFGVFFGLGILCILVIILIFVKCRNKKWKKNCNNYVRWVEL